MNYDLQFDAAQAAKLLERLSTPDGRAEVSSDPHFVIGMMTYHLERLIALAEADRLERDTILN